MAHNLHYYFDFVSQNGRAMQIQLLQRDYDGPALKRNMGQPPVLRREANELVLGSSLEIYAECTVDEEFAIMFTSDPFEWQVKLIETSTQAVMWRGHASPELYSEPLVAPPYDVQIIATDGLGELKFHTFNPEEVEADDVAQTDSDMWPSVLRHLLKQTGYDFEGYADAPYFVSTLNPGAPYKIVCDWSDFAGKTCYEVLQSMLAMLNSYVMLVGDRWYFIRINDLRFGNSTTKPIRPLMLNTVDWTGDPLTIHSPRRNIGPMGASSGTCSPVGRLAVEIMPATNRVVVSEIPVYNEWGVLKDGDMTEMSLGPYPYRGLYWIRPSSSNAEKLDGSGYWMNGQSSVIQQTVNVLQTTSTLNLGMTTNGWNNLTGDVFYMRLYMKLGDTTYKYLRRIDPIREGSGYTYEWRDYTGDASRIPEIPVELGTPRAPIDHNFSFSGFPVNGPLTIEFSGTNAAAFSIRDAYIRLSEDNNAYITESICTVSIDNAAREALSDIEIEFNNGTAWQAMWRRDILLNRYRQTLAEWKSDRITATRLLEFLALDKALEYALPRLRLKGVLDTPSSLHVMPIAFRDTHSSVDYFAETFTWDLYYDEMEIDLISIPAADISVEDMVVTYKDNL